MPISAAPQTNFFQINDTHGVYLADMNTLPPDIVKGAVPHGWFLTGEVLDFQVGGECVEVYLLERGDT